MIRDHGNGHRDRHGHRHGDRHGDRDEGAVAVVVALVVVLVLIPVAALAVDLGSSYTLTSALQHAADAAARAGAQELARRQRLAPDDPAAAMEAARTAAIDVLCADPLLRPREAGTTGFAAQDCATGGRAWASDDDHAPAAPTDPAPHPNGEIEFYRGGVSATTHAFTAGQRATGGGTGPITGIRVVTPPATVRYAFAPVIGVDSGVRQARASARLLTVLPLRDWDDRRLTGTNLQLYLTAADLVSAPGRTVAWCARSAPRESWDVGGDVESRHPTGVCDVAAYPTVYPWVPRGYLTAASSARVRYAPGGTVQLQGQRWTDVARMRDLRPGLLDGGGRLVQGGCRGGTSAQSGGYTGLESAYLRDFVQTGVGSAADLKALLLSGGAPTAAQEGWLSPDVLRCGRLAVLPVLGGVPAPFGTVTGGPYHYGLTTTTYPVTALRLVWIDSAFAEGDTPIAASTPNTACLQRGLYWESPYTAGWCPPRDEDHAPLRAITGFVIDPKLLPAIVTGDAATNVTDYAPSGLPATVRMVRDLGDPPAS